MGDTERLVARAGVQDLTGPRTVHTVRAFGYLAQSGAADIVRRFDAALANDPSIQAIVLDVLDLDGFEPGVPARLIQWFGRNVAMVRVGVLATLSPVLTATVRAAGILQPNSRFGVAGTRAEAQQFALQLIESRVREAGIRTRTPVSNARKVSG